MRDWEEAAMEAEFRHELEKALAGTGLDARFDCHLPAVLVPGRMLPHGAGYWIGYGLQHYPSVPPAQWPTFLFASYTSEDEGEPQSVKALDVVMMDKSARNAHLAAAMVVAEVTADVTRRRVALGLEPAAAR